MNEQEIREIAIAAFVLEHQEQDEREQERERIEAAHEAERLAALRPQIAEVIGIDRDWTEPLILNGHRLVAGRQFGTPCLYDRPLCVECGAEYERDHQTPITSLAQVGRIIQEPAKPLTCFSCGYAEAKVAVPDSTPEAAFVAALVDLLRSHGYQFSDGSGDGGYAMERLQERMDRVSKDAASARRTAADAESRAADAEDMARKATGRRY